MTDTEHRLVVPEEFWNALKRSTLGRIEDAFLGACLGFLIGVIAAFQWGVCAT